LNSVFGALAKLALLVLPVCRLVGRGKTKCANAGWQNFKIFCAVGKKIKHRRVGNECRLTRCPFVISFLCLCSPVKMVYFFLVYVSRFLVAVSFSTLAGNSKISESSHIHNTLKLSLFCPPLSQYAKVPVSPFINLGGCHPRA